MTGDRPSPWLIVGGGGLIGQAMAIGLRSRGVPVISTFRQIGEPDSICFDLAADATLLPALPRASVAVIAAAMTGIEACEKEPALARRVNVIHTLELVERLRNQGTHVVVLSSSAVFGSRTTAPTPDDPRIPANLYGQLKAELEDGLSGRTGVAILRPTKVLSARLPRIAGWAASLLSGNPVSPLGNLGFSPVHLSHAVDAITAAGTRGLEGIWHVSGSSTISYYRFMQLLADALGVDRRLVECSGEDVPAKRLPIAHLDTGKWESICDTPPPDPKSVANLLSREILHSLPPSFAGRRSQPIEGTTPDPS